MTTERTPQSFTVGPARPADMPRDEPRRPLALKGERMSDVVVENEFPDDDLAPPPPVAPKKGLRLGRIFMAAFGALISLGIGLWVDRLVRSLFSRADWLGWAAAGLAVIAGLALLAIVIREICGIRRLASVETLRRDGADAVRAGTLAAARGFVARLTAFLGDRPQTAAGRAAMEQTRDEIMDGQDLIRLAEIELLSPIDETAKRLVMDAAKRVSVVTAVSPRALVDVAYIVFETGRLIRRIAELYGARPGSLGYFRLVRNVLAHLAVTGVMAAGDEFVHQVVGQGLAARLSAKLGEGIVNGVMTVRVGLAAMEVVRPLPYLAVKRPGVGDFVTALASFARRQQST